MLKKLQWKLTLLYTLSTGIILMLVVGAVSSISQLSMRSRIDEAFQNQIMNIGTKLQTDGEFNITWLASTEADNRLVIHIEENHVPLWYKGSWNPPTDRETLIAKAKETARSLNTDVDMTPVSSYSLSPVFTVYGDHKDEYRCIAMTYPLKKGYKSMVLLNYASPALEDLKRQQLLFLLLGCVGITGLFFTSWFLVKRSLAPIRENQIRQQQFIAAASHELRSPLMVIQSSAEAVEALPDQAAKFTAAIRSECHRMNRLVGDLLTLASAASGTWTVQMQLLDPNTLLLDIYEKHEALLQEKGLPLHLKLPSELLPMIHGDPERLSQLMGILLDNASTYGKSERGITLRAFHRKNYLFLQVIDHGPGIPSAEKKEQIFERFYRADNSRKDKQHFGLGLNIALELAQLHKGSLSVSDTPGGGATFTLKLPMTTKSFPNS